MQTRRRLYLLEIADPEDALQACARAVGDGHRACLWYLPRSDRFAVAAYLRPLPDPLYWHRGAWRALRQIRPTGGHHA